MQCPKGMVVDHMDGNTFNNQRSNLRVCTVQENSQNRVKVTSRNLSGHLGVSPYRTQKLDRFRAHITINGILTHIGYFDDLEDAIAARKAAAAYWFGAFAPRI
jgi:HNH endonuclease